MNKTRVIFKIEKELLDNYKSGKIVKPVYLETSEGQVIIDYELSKMDKKFNYVSLKYVSIALISIGLIFFLLLGFFYESKIKENTN